MESRNEEFLRVANYVASEAHGTLKSTSLAEIIRDKDGIGRIYEVCIEPDREWYGQHLKIEPLADWWVVAFEPTRGEFDGAPAILNLYCKRDFPLAKEAYGKHREIIE